MNRTENVKAFTQNRKEKSRTISAFLFSAVLLVGISVCLICDFAVFGRLTWSLISVSSMIFAWAVFFPGIRFAGRGMLVSLISFSVLIVPYLFLLSRILRVKEVFSIGAVTALISVVFLWILAAVFGRAGKTRRLAACGILCLLAVPLQFVINVMLSRMIDEPVFDVWDLLTVMILLLLAFVSFVCDYARKRRC